MRENARAIVVLGVHRGGTSTLAGALGVFGVDLGRRLIPDNEWNERGHFELAEVVRIDNALLALSGKTWDCIDVPPYAEIAARAGALAADARRFLDEEFGDAALFGLKDPRMCRLLPFWQDVFGQLGASDSYVIALRNPLSVARSLERRDGFATEKGCLLWLQHMRAAVAATRERRAVVVDYDRFVDDPVAEIKRIATHLKLEPPSESSSSFRAACAALVDASLRHGAFDEQAAYGDPRVPDSVKDLYRALKMVARDLAALPPLAERTANAKASGADYPWLARVVPFVEDELVRARAGIDALGAQVEHARTSHAARDGIEAALRDQIARLERDLADERATIAALTQELDRARAAADIQANEIAAARENIEALVSEIVVARDNAEIQNQQIDDARQNIEALVQQIEVARSNDRIRQQQIEDLVTSLEDTSRQVAERAQREAVLRNDVQRLSEEAGALRSERDVLAPALRETQEAAAAISADRDRLAQLERTARERGALLDSRIGALQVDVHALRARDEANSAELARLQRTWYGRLARRLARRS